MSKFKPLNEGMSFLLPPNIEDFVPDDHLARTVSEVVDSIDTTPIENKYSNLGQNTYHPKIMLKILFYGYAVGVRSGRKIAQRCKTDTAFMYLARMYQPDFRTISDFRKNNLKEIESFFVEIVNICRKVGMVKAGLIAIDGSKMKANASSRRTKDKDGFDKWYERLGERMRELLEDGIRIDEEEDGLYGEDKTGDELPEELRSLERLRQKIKEARDELKGKEKKNLTDPEARLMKLGRKGIRPGYNNQIAATENQVIVAADVTCDQNDRHQLAPMIEQMEKNFEGEFGTILADSGYESYDNCEYLSDKGVDALIPDQYYRREKEEKEKDRYRKKNFTFDRENNRYICPEGKILKYSKKISQTNGKRKRKQLIFRGTECGTCPVKDQCTTQKARTISREMREHLQEEMRSKLDSAEGKETYKKRMHMVEPIFGNLKYNLGYETFHLRSRDKVTAEFKLMCIGNNLKKIWKFNLASA